MSVINQETVPQACLQANGGIFPINVLSSQVTLACLRLQTTKQKTTRQPQDASESTQIFLAHLPSMWIYLGENHTG